MATANTNYFSELFGSPSLCASSVSLLSPAAAIFCIPGVTPDSLRPVDGISPPTIVTPAAPRSRAEMTSGLWTPQDALEQTWERYKSARALTEAQMQAGANYSPWPDRESDKKNNLKLQDVLVVAGIGLFGLVLVKQLVRG